MIYKFPKGFMWGTSTAAHQIEGNNANSDWWHWENRKKKPNKPPQEPSNQACDSYNRYEEDFDLAVKMNNNTIRFSLEWARIEPKEGEFDQKEIEHYRKMLQAAKDRNLTTVITLHHFTSPQWIAKKGGWTNSKTPKYFEKYAKKCAEEFDDLIDNYLTINEPQVYSVEGYLMGRWYPGKINPIKVLKAQFNFAKAHNLAYKTIKTVSNKPVGIVKNLMWNEAAPNGGIFIDKWIAQIVSYLGTEFFLNMIKNNLDYIGLNYYITNQFKWGRWSTSRDYVSDLKWWINPEGLEKVLLRLKKYNLPLLITENGLADSKDKYRKQFLRDHLISVHKAIQQGVNVIGYLHWSLLDNFEWSKGFWPRFGLIEIDRENNLQRKPRESFYYYAKICKNNMVDETF